LRQADRQRAHADAHPTQNSPSRSPCFHVGLSVPSVAAACSTTQRSPRSGFQENTLYILLMAGYRAV
jgi:hypothetical protein